MATRQVLKEEFLTCIICHEVFRDPVTLHCGHTLCAQCVTEYTKTQKDALQQGCLSCPHCRGMTKVPDSKETVQDWTTQLKTGLFVNALVEKFALEGKDDDDSCSLCKDDGETRPASVWCSDCGHALCSECQKVHGKLNTSHEVSDITGEYDMAVMRKPRRAVCQKHPEFAVDLFCEDCDLAICQKCNTLQHGKCESVILLEDALSKIDPVLEGLKNEVDMKVAAGQSKVTDLTSHIETLHSSTAQAETEIHDAMEKLMTRINEKEKQLKDELAQRKQKTLQRLKANIKSQGMRLEEYRQRQSFLQHAAESTDANTRYEAYKLFSKAVEAEGLEPEPEEYEEYTFEDNTDTLLNVLDKVNYGKIKMGKIAERIKPKLVKKMHTSVKSISGITVMHTNCTRTIVISSTGSNCIKSFSTNDDMIIFREDSLNLRDEVYDVTKISETTVAACLYSMKQIVFFTVEPQLTVVGKVITWNSYFGLTYLHSSTFGALTNLPGRVDIINMSGRILRTFGTDILHDNPYPGYITALDNSRLLVSDGRKCQTVMFDHQGQVQFLTDHCGKRPAGVCQGRNDELFVVVTNKVCQLSECGEVVSDVITIENGPYDRSTLFVDDKFMYISVQSQYICIYQYLS